MKTEDIFKMAREAGFDNHGHPELWDYMVASDAQVERFFTMAYEAGVADEREACAKVCEIPADVDDWEIRCGSEGRELCNDLAATIRVRGLP